MTIFGTELPERVEFLGVFVDINPATLLIAGLVIVLIAASLFYGARQRTVTVAAHEAEFDFFRGMTRPEIGNIDEANQMGNLQIAHLKSGLVSIEEEVTQSTEIPALSENAPARQAYVNDGHHLPKVFGSD